MEVFSDPKTRLTFPAKIGSLTRQSITTYELASAGYSVIYQLKGWLGGIKSQIAIDVYDKGIKEPLPEGPNSPFVAIELQNSFHSLCPAAVPAVDPSLFEDYLDESTDALSSLSGQVSGPFRVDTGTGNGIAIGMYLTIRRNHFVKVTVMDMTAGRSLNSIAPFFLHINGQLSQ